MIRTWPLRRAFWCSEDVFVVVSSSYSCFWALCGERYRHRSPRVGGHFCRTDSSTEDRALAKQLCELLPGIGAAHKRFAY